MLNSKQITAIVWCCYNLCRRRECRNINLSEMSRSAPRKRPSHGGDDVKLLSISKPNVAKKADAQAVINKKIEASTSKTIEAPLPKVVEISAIILLQIA